MNKCDPFYCEGLKRGHIGVIRCLTFWAGELAGGRLVGVRVFGVRGWSGKPVELVQFDRLTKFKLD